jgi:hypothetical protein
MQRCVRHVEHGVKPERSLGIEGRVARPAEVHGVRPLDTRSTHLKRQLRTKRVQKIGGRGREWLQMVESG